MVIPLLRRQLRLLLEQDDPQSAAFEAEQLLQWATGLEHAQLLLENEVSEEAAEKAVNAARKRLKGEPLQYIIGQWEFYGLPFKVGEGVLIPRQETELLAEKALEALPDRAAVLDLCSGSGCIPIAIAKNSSAKCIGIELSDAALEYFNQNIILNCIEKQVISLKGDVLQPSEQLLRQLPEKFHLITANPPYLTAEEMQQLQKEVRHEPETALYGGKDGLDFYRVIFGRWKGRLAKGGRFIAETGDSQAKDVKALMEKEGFCCKIYEDFNKIGRVVEGRLQD